VNLRLAASFVAPALLGIAVVQYTCRRDPRSVSNRTARVLAIGLGIPLGLGICSCLYFVWLNASGPPGPGLALVESVVAVCAAGALLLGHAGTKAADSVVNEEAAALGTIGRVLPVTVALAALCALAGFALTVEASPHGHWYAWMTWNLGARLLFRGGEQWTVAFSDTLRHPDYPMLLQGAVARAWYYAGTDTIAAPITIAFLFTAATVMMTWGAVDALRSRVHAHLAALVLLTTTFLVIHGASQYADVPVGCYYLAAVVFFGFHDAGHGTGGWVLLAGLATGLGGWTKNEGLMFMLVLATARCAAVWPLGGTRRCTREMGLFGLGAAPALLLAAYFKLYLAPPNYLFSSGDHGLYLTLGRLLDPERYRVLAGAVKGELLAFGDTGLAWPFWVLLAFLLCVGLAPRRRTEPTLRMAVLTGCFMAAGHLLVLLIAPGDMPRLASASLTRLALQLWPVFVLASVMGAAIPLERASRVSVGEQQWT
jgi:hypothetical protein